MCGEHRDHRGVGGRVPRSVDTVQLARKVNVN
jgi:hypothetical protein